MNIDRVREIQHWFNGDYLLILEDQSRIPSSRSNSSALRTTKSSGANRSPRNGLRMSSWGGLFATLNGPESWLAMCSPSLAITRMHALLLPCSTLALTVSVVENGDGSGTNDCPPSALYRLRTSAGTVTRVVTLMAHGCPLQAIVIAFGFDERTVAS